MMGWLLTALATACMAAIAAAVAATPAAAACTFLSRAINRLTGGKPNQSLCARIARRHGHDCWFCRVVGAVTRDRDHCWSALVGDVRRK